MVPPWVSKGDAALGQSPRRERRLAVARASLAYICSSPTYNARRFAGPPIPTLRCAASTRCLAPLLRRRPPDVRSKADEQRRRHDPRMAGHAPPCRSGRVMNPRSRTRSAATMRSA